MEGRTMYDIIFNRLQPSLTEDEVVDFIRSDNTYAEWDDWTVRMTFRINSYLRSAPSIPGPDVNFLNSF